MRATYWTREHVIVRFKLGPRHITKVKRVCFRTLWLTRTHARSTHVCELVLTAAGHPPAHQGALGGLLIGLIGALLPETLFWAEHESQTIIDAGATPLPHVWPGARNAIRAAW